LFAVASDCQFEGEREIPRADCQKKRVDERR
jgi:hypothetical protein